MPSPRPFVIPEPDPIPGVDPGAVLFDHYKRRFGMYQPLEFANFVRNLKVTGHLVAGFMPASSVNLLVGDSGVGKSALAYQLALATAAGIPFLGMSTRQSKVVLVDYENSAVDSLWVLQQQRKHLGLAASPDTLMIWPMQNCPDPNVNTAIVEKVTRQFAADLVIYDSLRSFNPAMEHDNATAVEQIKRLRVMTTRHGTAAVLVHHVRKLGSRGRASLEDGDVLEWLTRSAGARALVNQTDVRLAVARPAARPGKSGAADLVLRGHCRIRGEIGPFLLTRKWDDSGEPAGYDRLEATAAMLENTDQEAAFGRLPESFTFKEARGIYGRDCPASAMFLHKLMRLGLVRKVARGQYRKIETGTRVSVAA